MTSTDNFNNNNKCLLLVIIIIIIISSSSSILPLLSSSCFRDSKADIPCIDSTYCRWRSFRPIVRPPCNVAALNLPVDIHYCTKTSQRTQTRRWCHVWCHATESPNKPQCIAATNNNIINILYKCNVKPVFAEIIHISLTYSGLSLYGTCLELGQIVPYIAMTERGFQSCSF